MPGGNEPKPKKRRKGGDRRDKEKPLLSVQVRFILEPAQYRVAPVRHKYRILNYVYLTKLAWPNVCIFLLFWMKYLLFIFFRACWSWTIRSPRQRMSTLRSSSWTWRERRSRSSWRQVVKITVQTRLGYTLRNTSTYHILYLHTFIYVF